MANVRGVLDIYADFPFPLSVKLKFGKSMEDLKEMHSKEVRYYCDFQIFGFVHSYLNIRTSCYCVVEKSWNCILHESREISYGV